jgi:hypothetical protein
MPPPWRARSSALLLKLHDGQEVSVGHLAPTMIACPCEPIGRSLAIRVTFANHCYTEKYDRGIHRPEQILLTEAPDRHRVFCPVRYGLSHRLPKLVASLPNRKVHQTAQLRNYVYVVPLEVEGQHYEIYFMLQRASGGETADLRLTVESAYPNGGFNVRKRPREIRFIVLAHKVLTNQRIHFAAR